MDRARVHRDGTAEAPEVAVSGALQTLPPLGHVPEAAVAQRAPHREDEAVVGADARYLDVPTDEEGLAIDDALVARQFDAGVVTVRGDRNRVQTGQPCSTDQTTRHRAHDPHQRAALGRLALGVVVVAARNGCGLAIDGNCRDAKHVGHQALAAMGCKDLTMKQRPHGFRHLRAQRSAHRGIRNTPRDAEQPADSARHEFSELLDAQQAGATGQHAGQRRSEQRRQLPAHTASLGPAPAAGPAMCTENPGDTAAKSCGLNHGLPPVLPTWATQHAIAEGLGWLTDEQPENIGIRAC